MLYDKKKSNIPSSPSRSLICVYPLDESEQIVHLGLELDTNIEA